MNRITINGKAYCAPSAWGNMHLQQLIIWTKILSKDIAVDDAMMLCVVLFYKIPKRIFFKLSPAQQWDLIESIKFIYGENKMYSWVLPSFRIGFTWYHSPQTRLSTSTIKEFRSTEFFYNAYKKTGDEKFVDQLIATLYRSKGPNSGGNDIRCDLTEMRIRKHAPAMARLNPDLRRVIIFTYEACRVFIAKKYPSIFKQGGTSSNAIPDMEPLIKIVAGGKFGTFKDTESTTLYLVLDHLKDEIEANEKNKP
jgi:hypothetical protein